MKYIMFQDSDGRKLPVLFPDLMVHQYVAWGIERALVRQKLYVLPTSAGFVTFNNVKTFGESETLSMKSKPIDADYIELGESSSLMPESIVATLAVQARLRR